MFALVFFLGVLLFSKAATGLSFVRVDMNLMPRQPPMIIQTDSSEGRSGVGTISDKSQLRRRDFLLISHSLLLGSGVMVSPIQNPAWAAAAAAAAVDEDRNTEPSQNADIIYRLKSGVQFRDDRIGNGPFVTEGYTHDEEKKSSITTMMVMGRPTVVMHVQALLRDGTVLMDTRMDGRPIVYQLGTAFENLGTPGVVTPGIDDALVSSGTLADSSSSSSSTGSRVPPMRQGGIRRVVVPASLAYGNQGLSRYQILKYGQGFLKKPVPRDEMIRYELEVLRCLEVPYEISGREDENETPMTKQTIQACCPEERYPCEGIPINTAER